MPSSTCDLRQFASSALTPSETEILPASNGVDMASFHEEIKSECQANGGVARRKVLADLDSNDSPIAGLIPRVANCFTSSTPASCDFKCGVGSQKSRMKPLSPAETETFSTTPLGESLLRSQVMRLLQQVDANVPPLHKPAPSLRSLCHLQSFMDSPALKIVAPTPINTPCSSISAYIQPSNGNMSVGHVSMPRSSTAQKVQTSLQEEDEQDQSVQNVQDAEVKLLEDLHLLLKGEIAASSFHSKASAQNGQITITTESVLPGRDHHIMEVTPLISTAYHQADLLMLGKKTTRTLQFDSPDKVVANPDLSSLSASELKQSFLTPAQQADDEISEWSLLVNVSSPDQTSKRDIDVDLANEANSADTSDSLDNEKKTVIRRARRSGTPFPKSSRFWSGDADDDDDDDVDGECTGDLIKDGAVQS